MADNPHVNNNSPPSKPQTTSRKRKRKYNLDESMRGIQPVFHIFLSEKNEEIRQNLQNRDEPVKPANITKEGSKLWKAMSAEEKFPYREVYKTKRDLVHMSRSDNSNNNSQIFNNGTLAKQISTLGKELHNIHDELTRLVKGADLAQRYATEGNYSEANKVFVDINKSISGSELNLSSLFNNSHIPQ